MASPNPAPSSAVEKSPWPVLPQWLGTAAWLWLMLILVGAIVLTLPGSLAVGGTKLSAEQAFLTAASAGTGNGWLVGRGLGEFSLMSRWVVVAVMALSTVLQWTIFGAAAARAVRGWNRELGGGRQDFFLPAVVMVLGAALFGLAAGTLWGAGLGGGGAGGALEGITLGIGALANCGLSAGPVPQDVFLAFLFPISVVGMIGAFGLSEIWRGLTGRGMAPEAWRAGAWLAGGWLVVLCFILVAQRDVPSAGAVETGALVGTARAYGVKVALVSLDEWPKWAIVVLGGGMFLGTLGLGGSGGGPGVLMWRTTVLGAVRSVSALMTGRKPLEARSGSLGYAVAGLAAWSLLWAGTWGALLATAPQVLAERSWLIAATCTFGGMGRAGFDVGALSGPSIWVMGFAMVAGKVVQGLFIWGWAVRRWQQSA